MKKHLLIIGIILLGFSFAKSQCVPNCSAYTVNPTTYSLFPTGGTNVNTAFAPNADDGYTALVPIGFTFKYYCTNYTDLYICSNGFVVFGVLPSINGADPAQSFPNSTSPNGLIALNMCDLDASAGGNITYTTIGATPNQKFIVTYSDVPYWYPSTPSATLTCSGQIVLYETSNIIEVHTATVGLQSYASTQGIENQSGSAGVNVPGRNVAFWSASNSAYQFTNLIQGTPPTAIGGTAALCSGATSNYTCSVMPGASSYNWTLPNGWLGSSTSNSIIATSGVSGNISVNVSYTCGTTSSIQFSVTVIQPPVISVTSVSPSVLCSGGIVSISASGGVNYTLIPNNITGVPPFTLVPTASTSYSIYGEDSNGCISINPGIAPVTINTTPTISVNDGTVCLGKTFTMNPTGAATYSFSSPFAYVTPGNAGVYTYTIWGYSASGCSTSAMSNLTVQALPSVSLSISKTSICINETVTLNASGATTYSWNGSSGLSALTITPAIPNPALAYSVVGTNSLGCNNSASITLKVSSCVGIPELSGENKQILVYPNPFKSKFHINSKIELKGNYYIYNITGALILSKPVNDSEFEINLENFASGIYYLKFNQSNELLKLIKID